MFFSFQSSFASTSITFTGLLYSKQIQTDAQLPDGFTRGWGEPETHDEVEQLHSFMCSLLNIK